MSIGATAEYAEYAEAWNRVQTGAEVVVRAEWRERSPWGFGAVNPSGGSVAAGFVECEPSESRQESLLRLRRMAICARSSENVCSACVFGAFVALIAIDAGGLTRLADGPDDHCAARNAH